MKCNMRIIVEKTIKLVVNLPLENVSNSASSRFRERSQGTVHKGRPQLGSLSTWASAAGDRGLPGYSYMVQIQ